MISKLSSLGLLVGACAALVGTGLGCGDDGDGSGGSGTGTGTGAGMGGSGTGSGMGGGGNGGGGAGGMTMTGANCDPASGAEGTVALTEFATGFSVPMMVTYAPGDDERLWVVERGGTIQLLKNGVAAGQFLDVSSLMVQNFQSEEGLLGLAFHPNYANNGRFWVHYSAPGGTNHLNAIQEFRRDPANPDVADPNPVHPPVITVDQFAPNHNGGHIEFSPVDGFLYIGIGDGGSSNDPQGNGPNKNTLLATLLRLDVNATDGTYDAPAGNITDGAPEIFDWGLRNPYRWSFDVCTGDRYIADVGQNAWEEVDVAPASQGATNWGWDCREGANDFGQSTNGCPFGDEVDPVWQYQHVGGGRSITGGYVYRGQAIPWLRGWYFFGDFVTGEVWRFQWDNGPVANVVDVTNVGGQRLTGFGQDNQGEVYVVDATGTIFQVTAQ
ncbi:MAG: PQQ-dependent sugar dehydrogenase [Polyangiaceae bacterium]